MSIIWKCYPTRPESLLTIYKYSLSPIGISLRLRDPVTRCYFWTTWQGLLTRSRSAELSIRRSRLPSVLRMWQEHSPENRWSSRCLYKERRKAKYNYLTLRVRRSCWRQLVEMTLICLQQRISRLERWQRIRLILSNSRVIRYSKNLMRPICI